MILSAAAAAAAVAALAAGEAGIAAALFGSLAFLAAQLAGRTGMQIAYSRSDPHEKVLWAVAAVALRFAVWTAAFAALLAVHRTMHETGAQWMIAGLAASVLAQAARDYRALAGRRVATAFAKRRLWS